MINPLSLVIAWIASAQKTEMREAIIGIGTSLTTMDFALVANGPARFHFDGARRLWCASCKKALITLVIRTRRGKSAESANSAANT
jgi:hypothetical protein